MPKPTVTVYGKQASRTSRVTWCCRELGVEFSHITEHAPLNYNPNDVFEVNDPVKFFLPKQNISSKYIFAKENLAGVGG